MKLDFSDEAIDLETGAVPPGTYEAVISEVKGRKSPAGNDLAIITWCLPDGRSVDDVVMFRSASKSGIFRLGLEKLKAILIAGGKPLQHENPMALMKALIGITALVEVAYQERNGVRREVVVAVKPLPATASSDFN
jgi:hypothetical protein